MKLTSVLLVVGTFARTLVGATSSSVSCPYLSEAAPIELELPAYVLASPTVKLQVTFQGFKGISPVVRRRQRAVGSKPKIIISRYSSEPTIEYDEITGAVVISAASCLEGGRAADGASGKSAAYSFHLAGAVTLASLLVASTSEILDHRAAALLASVLALPLTSARKLEECTPSVEVFLEAPAAYRGSVETCLAEVFEKGHCPEPFPTFKTCDDAAPVCPLVVVGAGTGGLYTALRMVDEGKLKGSDICIFEMTERVGGRLLSVRGLGPNGDLSVDAGGYRTWPEYTPTVHALITEYLNITMDCYDKAEVPCGKFNIVDKAGKKAGFATFVEEMMTRLVDKGACFFPYHELEYVEIADSATLSSRAAANIGDVTMLHFTNGVTATATFSTVLNIPQRPLLSVMRNSNLSDAILNAETLDAMHSVQTAIVSKLYLYYPKGEVWWHKLGLTSGDFEAEGDARNMLLQGRYHDGHVECDDDSDVETCHGFLLAVYANDLSGNKAQFFRQYQRERPDPVTIISNSDLEGKEFLKHAHSQLEKFHLYGNAGANYTPSSAYEVFQTAKPPEFAVLSTWNTAIPWAGGGWHSWTDLANVEKAMKPLVNNNIFVVNEAYSLLQGWAEGTLKSADDILLEFFGVERPWSFPLLDLVQEVAQTASSECAAVVEETVSAGDSGGATEVENVLCFTADALVLMADGSSKPISQVMTGEFVFTGTDNGAGLVTQALIHPVDAIVPVAIVATPFGDLVGTPEHPVLINDEWQELGIIEGQGVTLSHRHINAFYNLEIDGDVFDESSHSYVVNGFVASGLGDNKDLNMRYPRQQIWKDAIDTISTK